MIDIEAVRKQLDGITQWPWKPLIGMIAFMPDDKIPPMICAPNCEFYVYSIQEDAKKKDYEDTLFIAAAPSLVSQMADEIERLQALVKELKRENI